MNFNKLKYFVTVAEEQSITRAAKRLYISQPSLSQCIRAIEDEMGVELFARRKNSVTLTRAGKIYYQWAKITLDSVRRLETDIAGIIAGTNRQLDVGTSWQRSAFLLPASIHSFYCREPGCNVKIHENFDYRLHERLKANELDLILGTPSQDTVHYTSIPVLQERFLLAAGTAYPMESTPGTPFNYIKREQIIGKPTVVLQERQNLGQNFRKLLVELNYTPASSTECINLETAHQLVKNNVGISLLPEICVVRTRYNDVNYYMLEGAPLGRTVSAVYRKGHPMEKEILELVDCVIRFIKEHEHPFITD